MNMKRGELPMIAYRYTGRFRPKGVPLSARDFLSWNIWMGMEIYHLGIQKGFIKLFRTNDNLLNAI